MVAGILVTHGNLGQELIDTARGILGDFDLCTAFSNKGKSTQGLYEEIAAAIPDDTPCIIMTDFLGGSCSHACLRVALDRRDVKLVSGINLPMLIAFVNKRREVPFEELPSTILSRARDAIKNVNPEDM
jgi:PTS system mannose-specific IIA component